MLTEYEGEIFNAEKNADSVSIWKYIPIKGFEKHTTRRGITYYEKVIKMEDVGELFDITFRALMNDKKFIVKSMNNEFSTPIALRSMEVVSLPQSMTEVSNSCFACRFREQPQLMKLSLIRSLQTHSPAPLSLRLMKPSGIHWSDPFYTGIPRTRSDSVICQILPASGTDNSFV